MEQVSVSAWAMSSFPSSIYWRGCSSTCVNNHLAVDGGLISTICSVSLVSLLCSFGYHGTGQCDVLKPLYWYPNFVLSTQDCFGYSVFCAFIWILGWLFLVPWGMALAFDGNYTQSVNCFGQYGHFNSINSSNPRIWEYFSFVVCLQFHSCVIIFIVEAFQPLS
jgi:hypothetical protein